jgi:hypothetical protein
MGELLHDSGRSDACPPELDDFRVLILGWVLSAQRGAGFSRDFYRRLLPAPFGTDSGFDNLQTTETAEKTSVSSKRNFILLALGKLIKSLVLLMVKLLKFY